MRNWRTCSRSRPHRRAFTLIELLVTVVIITILVGLVGVGYSRAMQSARKTQAVSNMRMIGQGILTYAADNNNRLPGPLWPGQMPMLDPNREGRLVRELSPYLGLEMPDEPVLIDLFVPPAYRLYPGAPDLTSARTYVVNMAVETTGGIINPWGSLTGPPDEQTAPVPLSRVPGNTWALSDADQLHPRVASAFWRGNTPSGIIHGRQRLALFFGGHVSVIDQEKLEVP